MTPEPKYRIEERIISNGQSTFRVQKNSGKMFSSWYNIGRISISSHREFPTKEKAKMWLDNYKAEQLAKVIYHEV